VKPIPVLLLLVLLLVLLVLLLLLLHLLVLVVLVLVLLLLLLQVLVLVLRRRRLLLLLLLLEPVLVLEHMVKALVVLRLLLLLVRVLLTVNLLNDSWRSQDLARQPVLMPSCMPLYWYLSLYLRLRLWVLFPLPVWPVMHLPRCLLFPLWVLLLLLVVLVLLLAVGLWCLPGTWFSSGTPRRGFPALTRRFLRTLFMLSVSSSPAIAGPVPSPTRPPPLFSLFTPLPQFSLGPRQPSGAPTQLSQGSDSHALGPPPPEAAPSRAINLVTPSPHPSPNTRPCSPLPLPLPLPLPENALFLPHCDPSPGCPGLLGFPGTRDFLGPGSLGRLGSSHR